MTLSRHIRPNHFFGTKAETLERLQAVLPTIDIPPLMYFSVQEWKGNPETIYGLAIRKIGKNVNAAIRSSAQNEDLEDSSMAGAFLSVLDVQISDEFEFSKAVNSVIASFDDNPNNQILVQTMTTNVDTAGVVMTYDIEGGAPYYVVSYDDLSGRTDSVTGGTGVHKTVYIHRWVADGQIESDRLRAIIRLSRLLEGFFGVIPLDIEFCITKEGVVQLLQVRRISTEKRWSGAIASRISERLPMLAQFVEENQSITPGLIGSSTIFSNMTDWNPAEMIGSVTTPLAASLYRELITKSVWQKARGAMGYKKMPPAELMVLLDWRPYIDVRASLNSFLPDGLPSDIAQIYIELSIDRIIDKPELNDKIEFEVTKTVMDFTFEHDLKEWYGVGLDKNSISSFREKLVPLTQAMLNLSTTGSLAQALDTIQELALLQRKRQKIVKNSAKEIHLAANLLVECQRLGTFPFAILARHAFAAETLLRSAVSRSALTLDRLHSFKQSITTVAGSLGKTMHDVSIGIQPMQAFLDEYGHLRPGTYDIRSLRYDHRPDQLIGKNAITVNASPEFTPTNGEIGNLNKLISEAGIVNTTGDQLLAYARQAIAGREYAKHIFSKNVSDTLECIASWSERKKITREEAAYIPIETFLRHRTEAYPVEDGIWLAEEAARNFENWTNSQSLRLGHIIRSPGDIFIVPVQRAKANFITKSRIEGQIVDATALTEKINLNGKIAIIDSADPGYDWLFSQGIAGLITKFGGANSHMAVRCSEFGLPAAIGCGEQTFKEIQNTEMIELNCSAQLIRVIK